MWMTEFVVNFRSVLVILKLCLEGDKKTIPCIEGKNKNYLVPAFPDLSPQITSTPLILYLDWKSYAQKLSFQFANRMLSPAASPV